MITFKIELWMKLFMLCGIKYMNVIRIILIFSNVEKLILYC